VDEDYLTETAVALALGTRGAVSLSEVEEMPVERLFDLIAQYNEQARKRGDIDE
jgi:hypothetical protein